MTIASSTNWLYHCLRDCQKSALVGEVRKSTTSRCTACNSTVGRCQYRMMSTLNAVSHFWCSQMLCVLQCHPSLPVLATSGIEHSIKLWSPGGAVTPVDPVSCALTTRKNQERIMSGPQMLRSISPRVFQVSSSDVLCQLQNKLHI